MNFDNCQRSIRLDPREPRFGFLAVAVLLVLVAGCPSVVPYEAAEEAPATELETAPPFAETTEEPPAANEGDNETASTTPTAEGDSGAVEEPVVTPPPRPAGGTPWGLADSDAPSESETPDLFANAADSESSATESAPDSSDAGGGFGDILADEYAELTGAKPSPAAESEDATAASPVPSANDGGFGAVLADEFRNLQAEPSNPDPEPTPTVEPQNDPEPLIVAPPVEPEPEPAEQTGSLLPFGDPLPVVEMEPEPPADDPLRDEVFDEPDVPMAEPSTPVETIENDPEAASAPDLGGDLFDSVPVTPDVEEPVREIAPEDSEEPVGIAALEPEPPSVTFPPNVPEAGEDPDYSTADAAVDPLPEVPVLAFNTRHLAWLLGAKLGLAELADLDGATPNEVAGWAKEVDRLASELGVTRPDAGPAADPLARRVSRLMQSAEVAGRELAAQHGREHAALLEISLKTNALLVIATERPELAQPVADALKEAAARARLPQYLWNATLTRLSSSTDADDVLDAVTELHESVELYLR